jgi:hypothetical protein
MSEQKWVKCSEQIPKVGDVVLYLQGGRGGQVNYPIVVRILRNGVGRTSFELVTNDLVEGRDVILKRNVISTIDFWRPLPEVKK